MTYFLPGVILLSSSDDIRLVVRVREDGEIQKLGIGDGVSAGVEGGHEMQHRIWNAVGREDVETVREPMLNKCLLS